LVWIVLIVAVPILIALVLAPIIRPRLTRAVRDECRQQYAQARTAADSAAADAFQPIRTRSSTEHPYTCGELRRRGALD
ncbi:MAG TPA: hypothetical protein VFS40_05135, partial [Gemmatimonadales bacterium]|nr:hypothetical protein [Gemmatimonadales bacterium]